MNLTDLQQLFAEIELTPSRKLGQNFLIDANVSSWIAAQLNVEPGDTVVEVGPGAGSLTRAILERTDRLILVEFDKRLAEFLRNRLQDREHVQVHEMDAVKFDTRQLFAHQPVKLIGNLPYSCAGEIMRNFLGVHSPISEAVVMVQREFAERICAQPRTKDFGVLTLRMQARWIPKILKHIGPNSFHPRPKIDSSVMSLVPRPADEFPVYDLRLFDSLVRRGFSQRRKQLKKTLNLSPEIWKPLAAQLDVSESTRAEELSLRQWIDLTLALDEHPLKDNPQREDEMFDVVDEANRVVDQKPRGQVHREGLRHRAVHIFLFNKAGELFLQKRSRLKDVLPGTWDSSAAGHLDVGEAYETAAVRELAEELSVDTQVEFVTELPPTAENGNEFLQLFQATSRAKPRWPASEVEVGQYFSIECIDEWLAARPQDFAGGFQECYAAWKQTAGATNGA